MKNITITIDNEIYPVKVILKKVKNINLKINEKNIIVLSCPKSFTQKEVIDFFQKHEDWLIKRITKNKMKSQDLIYLDDKKYLYLLGNRYEVVLTALKEDHLKIVNEFIFVFSKNSLAGEIYPHYHNLLIEKCKNWLDDLNTRAEIKVKKYKSRWGCCKYSTKEIFLNEKLICLPSSLIDYVICHEIAHLKVPNHSPLYYKELEKISPNHKKYKQEIKKYRLDSR